MLSCVVLNVLIEINAYHYAHAHAYTYLQMQLCHLKAFWRNVYIIIAVYFG